MLWWWGQKRFFGRFLEISFSVLPLNPESNCTSRLKDHSLFHWNTLTLPELPIRGCNVGETYWRLLERWWQQRIVGCMDRFHEIHFIEWEATDVHGPGGDWRGNKRPEDPTMCRQICGSICLMHGNAKKSKTGPSRSQNSIMPEDNVVLFSIELGDEVFKRRKLEIPMPAAMPCRLQLHQHREASATVGQHKTKYACIVDAD